MENFEFLKNPLIVIDFSLNPQHRFIIHINKGLILFNEILDIVIQEVERVNGLDETCPGIQRELAEKIINQNLFS